MFFRGTSLLAAMLCVGLSPADAQQAVPWGPPTPLFQGIMVDANRKTVGVVLGYGAVVRQIDGIWVTIDVGTYGITSPNPGPVQQPFYYQSKDCTGPRYFDASTLPVLGVPATVPIDDTVDSVS